ncbi:cytochrome P450 [Podospora didyma]|uniref:Cytochrome P450 n=1 Tax=Podospora didyma TaxID=330526 RepID=A0AAE0KAL9_9PEZI|nr:cytochrome P450 [Podospora didyma]
MTSQLFFLVGDSPSTARPVPVNVEGKFDDLRRAVALVLHVAVPQGLSFHKTEADTDKLESVQDVWSAAGPVAVRVDGLAVQDPQGPPGLPVVGSFYEIFPDHLGNHYRLFRKYGHVIKTVNMGKTNYLSDSPEVALVALSESAYFTKKISENHPLWGIKDNTAIFIGDTETENWRLAHKFIPPSMGPKAVRHYTPLMQECVRSSFPIFDELDSRGEAWNVYQFMVKLASQTIGKFAFGKNLGHFDSVEAPAHPLITNIVNMLSLNKKVTARGEWYRSLPWGDSAKLKAVQKTVYAQMKEAVDDAPSSGIANLPFGEAATRASCVADYLVNAVDETGSRFPEGLVLSNMIVITGAGYTTTSALMSWLVYCIVTYPDCQDKLLQELIDYGISPSTQWTPELAHGLPYMDKFVKETQRLHNASFQPGRTTKTEVILPGGYRLPANATVIPALYAVHTNPEHWHDPFRFDPERWDTNEVKNDRHRAAYIPFATGARGCIGFNFALLEVKVLLSELVYRYKFAREGLEAVEYDPEFQLIRPLNFIVSKMTWTPSTTGSRPVAVLGAGVLGRRIACCFVSGGYNVHIRDPSAEARRAAVQYIDENKEAYTKHLPATTLTKDHKFGSYVASELIDTAVKEAWLVIEAVPEKIELKIDTMAELDHKAPADCIFGSNSSSFKSRFMLDKVTSPERRKRICNVHFTMPPKIRTVELMTDGETEPGVFPFLTEVLERCGMLPATAQKESTGFIFNRLWAAVKREIMFILAEEVSTPAEIDKLWRHMFQAEIAPCRLMDQIGLDTVAFIEDNYIQERHLNGAQTVDFLRANYLAKGKLGLKSDKGGLYPSASAIPSPPLTIVGERTRANSPDHSQDHKEEPALYFLDVGFGGNCKSFSDVSTNGKILRRDPSTGLISTIVSSQPAPDGIDILGDRIFWTNMGRDVNARDGSVMSSKLDGSDIQTLIPEGLVTTPKQMVAVASQKKLYFCDREGMGLHRVSLDGKEHEVLIQRTSEARDLTKWCVGITVDVHNKKVYWTQKGASKSNQGRIFRAGMEIPPGQTAETRSDIELVFGDLPEPIDLEIEQETGMLYWTDRGEHPRGSSLNRGFVDGKKEEIEVLARHFHEPIGLKLDAERRQVFVTDLGGSVYSVDMDNGAKTVLHSDDGCYTGIATVSS